MIQIPRPKSHPKSHPTWSGRTTKTAPCAASSCQMAQELSPGRRKSEEILVAWRGNIQFILPLPWGPNFKTHVIIQMILCGLQMKFSGCHLTYVAFPMPFWLNLPNWNVICAARTPHLPVESHDEVCDVRLRASYHPYCHTLQYTAFKRMIHLKSQVLWSRKECCTWWTGSDAFLIPWITANVNKNISSERPLVSSAYACPNDIWAHFRNPIICIIRQESVLQCYQYHVLAIESKHH